MNDYMYPTGAQARHGQERIKIKKRVERQRAIHITRRSRTYNFLFHSRYDLEEWA